MTLRHLLLSPAIIIALSADAFAGEEQLPDFSLQMIFSTMGQEFASHMTGRHPALRHGNMMPVFACGLSVGEGEILSVPMNAVTIYQFIDDTNKDLNSRQGGPHYSQMPPSVDEDGKKLFFGIRGQRALGEGANRVYVRGSIRFTIAAGAAEETEPERLPLIVGQPIENSPVPMKIFSITTSGSDHIQVTFRSAGPITGIRRLKFVDDDGNLIPSRQVQRIDVSDHNRVGTLNYQLPMRDAVSVVVELTENVKEVIVPFEVLTTLGEIRQPDDGDVSRTDAWPPSPNTTSVTFPASKFGIESTTRPATRPTTRPTSHQTSRSR